MSALVHSGHKVQTASVEVSSIRWMAGVTPGRYYVFITGIDWRDWFVPGFEAVMDDFGSLVRVEVQS